MARTRLALRTFSRLGQAANVPDGMTELLKDEGVQQKLDNLRKAVEEYRKAVEQVEEK